LSLVWWRGRAFWNFLVTVQISVIFLRHSVTVRVAEEVLGKAKYGGEGVFIPTAIAVGIGANKLPVHG
jgi:hypothetical protein